MASTSPGEPCLVDVDAADGRTSMWSGPTESSLSSHKAEFIEVMFDRDGETCVVTGDHELFCEACHIIPHSKGNDVRFHQSYFVSLLTVQSIYQASSVYGVQRTVLLKK